MFCFNCGTQVMDGARFCPNCGANLSAVSGGKAATQPFPVSRQMMNTPVEETEGLSEELLEMQAIEGIFHNVFNKRRQFGEQVYLIGKDPVSQEIKENLQEYWLSDDPNDMHKRDILQREEGRIVGLGADTKHPYVTGIGNFEDWG